MFIYKIVYIIISIYFINFLNAADIKGSIFDSKTKEPLIGASIYLDGKNIGTASDIDGSYQLKNIQSCKTCKYTLKTTYIGYLEFKKDIELLEDNDIFIDIFLDPSNIEVEGTTVTAQRRQIKITDAPAAVEIISAGDIKREESTNLGSYLKGIKGVDFTSSGINNYSISVRGFNSSFTTRLLTLTDGRIANIPALRVINYSTIPQSSKDIDNIEVVLGPSTALYGANAHSGVVNITSKSPADSEGFDVSVSGSINDARNLYKVNSRWATKLNKKLSLKVSGMYLQANEWEFIDESEYKTHSYPYSGTPARIKDRKDNNPWRDVEQPLIWAKTNDGRDVIIGDGEQNDTGDPDGDGVMGEDWFNGYDDDQDGLVDEDYFEADGIDNDGDCIGDTNMDGCVCCGFKDENGNGVYDDGEPYGGRNGDFDVYGNPAIDENIDTNEDWWYDGYDNDGNNEIDDTQEQDTGAVLPNWQINLEDREVIIINGRKHEYLYSEPLDDYGSDGFYAEGDTSLMDADGSEFNGAWDPNEVFKDLNGDGVWNIGQRNYWYDPRINFDDNLDLKGISYYDEELTKLLFDVFLYDFGDDKLPGDQWIDVPGDGDLVPSEGNNSLLDGTAIPFEGCLDNNNDGFCNNFLHPINNPDGVDIFIDGQGFNPNNFHDCGLDGECEFIYTDVDFLDLDNDGIPTADEVLALEEQLAIDPNYCTCTLPGFQCAFWQNPCSGAVLTSDNPNWDGADVGEANGQWDAFDYDYGLQNENDCNTQGGIWYGNPDNPNDLALCGDGNLDSGDDWIDRNGDGLFTPGKDIIYDTWPIPDGIYDPNWDIHDDCGQDGLCPGDFGYIGPDPGEGDNITRWVDRNEGDFIFDTGDQCFGCGAEPFSDCGIDQLCPSDEGWEGKDFGEGNGIYDYQTEIQPDGTIAVIGAEDFVDTNGDGSWTPKDYEENFQKVDDINGDGLPEYPDFEVKNTKAEVRLDYDPSSDLNISFQTGFSWSKQQQVTGTGRYLVDGYSYTYYQLRGRYKNWFAQAYLNQGNSGDTRSYLLGNVIRDKSKNLAFQIQHNFNIKNTQVIWGFDMFKTMANTNGTILMDGPNGYDSNANGPLFSADRIDNDRDSDDYTDLNGNNKADPGDYDPRSAGPDGIFDTDDDEWEQYSTGVNPDGFVFKDNKDNDGDAQDVDGDGYYYFQEIRQGSDPNDINSIPLDLNGNPMIIADQSLAIDELIDENFCDNPEQYKDFVSEDYFSGTRSGQLWECGEGYDDEDEFVDVVSKEQGFYLQTKTIPRGDKRWEIITAFRFDQHDRLDEGLQFAPKFGLFYKPNDYHTYRFTYGKAFNTPSAITLYTDLFIQNYGLIDYFLRGNENGTPYFRDTENLAAPKIKIGSEYFTIGSAYGQDYWEGDDCDNSTYVNWCNAPFTERVDGAPYYVTLIENSGIIGVTELLPLDTARYTIYVPELNDTGRVYTALEALTIPDVEPIKTEKIQTIELGFKGFLSERVHASIDYYASFYEDFFSSPTIITPFIIERQFKDGFNDKGERIKIDITSAASVNRNTLIGFLPINYEAGNYPYTTQINGLDDDDDWDSQMRFPFFRNDADSQCDVYTCSKVYANKNEGFDGVFNIDVDNDGTPDAFDWSLSTDMDDGHIAGFGWAEAGEGANPGQWGFVDYVTCEGGSFQGNQPECFGHINYSTRKGEWNYKEGNDPDGLAAMPGDTIGITLYHPEDVLEYDNGNLTLTSTNASNFWQNVGIDEFSILSGLHEAEPLPGASSIKDIYGNPIAVPAISSIPAHSILAPLNYGEVNMQGVDFGITYFMPEYNLSFDSNFSFYKSTEYYNSITKKNDPINAPKFKMNASINWKSKKEISKMPRHATSLKYRHVDEFVWKDGIWSGMIGPYDIFDLFYSFKINKYLEYNLTVQNMFDKVHKQMIGGAKMGRQIIMRITASI